MTALTPQAILELLREPTPPPTTGGGVSRPFVHDPDNDHNVPRNKHVQWLETKTVCDPGNCGSHAHIAVDGKPRCLKHAFDDLVNLLNKLEREVA